MFKAILAIFLGLLLGTSPALAKSPQVCSQNAEQVVLWSQLKDQGVPQEVIWDKINLLQIPEGFRRQVEQEMKQELDRVYKSKGTSLENAKDYFFRCLDSPENVEEKSV